MQVPERVPKPPPWASQLLSVGVTGTNGKTTTTRWVAAALGAVATPVVRGTTVGFFLDETRLDVSKDFAGFMEAMHACASKGGRYAALELTSEALARGFARAWPCKVGVFTNLTHDHLDAHGSPEHYLASKAQLFIGLAEGGTAVLNAADASSSLLRDVVPQGVSVRTYAVPSRGEVEGDVDILAERVDVTWSGTRVRCRAVDGLPSEISVRAVGEVYAENALAALLGAVAAGVPADVAAEAISRAEPPPGRFEVVVESPHVVVDYAHTPDAVERTVAAARAIVDAEGRGGRVIQVFGAGGRRDQAKRPRMGEAARRADVVVLTSDNAREEDPAEIARAMAQGLEGHADVRVLLDRREAIRAAVREARADDVVLVCGKGHETEQIVGGRAEHFSDAEEARAAAEELRRLG